jgi:hypothetical protein
MTSLLTETSFELLYVSFNIFYVIHPLSYSLVAVVRLVHLRMLWLPADRLLGFFLCWAPG